MQEHMLRIPLIGQATAILPDGKRDPDWATDCGEACCSAVLLALGYGLQIGFSPGELRRLIRSGWQDVSGRTTGRDLVTLLWNAAKVPAHVRDSTIIQLHVEMGNLFQKRSTAIILGNWDGVPHWVTLCGVNGQGLVVMDPWQPSYRHLTWATVLADYLGEYVHIDRSGIDVNDIPF